MSILTAIQLYNNIVVVQLCIAVYQHHYTVSQYTGCIVVYSCISAPLYSYTVYWLYSCVQLYKDPILHPYEISQRRNFHSKVGVGVISVEYGTRIGSVAGVLVVQIQRFSDFLKAYKGPVQMACSNIERAKMLHFQEKYSPLYFEKQANV